MRTSLFTSFAIASFVLALPVYSFQKTQCQAIIVQGLQNGSIKPDDSIFRRNGMVIMNDPTNIQLTVPGCEAKCGRGFSWYVDVGPRLSTWLIPVVVLIGNMCFSPLGKPNSLLAILHLLGDPIDSLWSLLTKLEIWNRCWDLAEQLSRNKGRDKNHVRDRATILVAIQELQGPGTDPRELYRQILHNSTIDGDDPEKPRLHHLCREIANELSDSSTNELPRTWLAIISYIWTVLGAFVEAVGGKSSSQPGGRIGAAMFLSWLIPVLLISNTVGSFTSRRTMIRILERFARETCPAHLQQQIPAQQYQQPGPDRRPSASQYLDLRVFSQDRVSYWRHSQHPGLTSFDKAQPWFGSMYTYIPSKNVFEVEGYEEKGNRSFALLVISFLPLIIANVAAFLIIYMTPTRGVTCRHIPLLAMSGIWIISLIIGRSTWRSVAVGKYHWYITLFKDTIIAIPSLLMIFLQSAGVFNSCFCWGSVYSLGPRAYVELDADNDRKKNAKTVYPALVGLCLFFQMVVFLLCLRLSKRGRWMMRRSEQVKMEDFWRLHKGEDTLRPEGPGSWGSWGTRGGFDQNQRPKGGMEMSIVEQQQQPLVMAPYVPSNVYV